MPVMMPAAGASSSYMPVRGQRRELEERAAGVEQRVDPVAGQQLAARDVPLPGALTAAQRHPLQLVGAGRRPARACAAALRAAASASVGGSGQHRCIHGQRLTPVHSDGPPHTPEWLTTVHFGASIPSRDVDAHRAGCGAARPTPSGPRVGSRSCRRPPSCSPSAAPARVGVDDVGAAVGVTGPAIYRHFAGKDAMLAEMLRADQRAAAGRRQRAGGRRRGGPGGPAARADRLPRRLRPRQPGR